jgi:hypothetical protein
MQSLEERLGMQSDCLMEKAVVLEEVHALTRHLREEAATARPVGASLAAAANAYQERLRKVTRAMMATISELSLYQVRGCGGDLLLRQREEWERDECFLIRSCSSNWI